MGELFDCAAVGRQEEMEQGTRQEADDCKTCPSTSTSSYKPISWYPTDNREQHWTTPSLARWYHRQLI